MPDAPKVWSDGSLISDSTTGVLVGILQVCLLSGVLVMSLIMIVLLLLCRIILMFGLMAVWFLITLLVFPLLDLGFLLISLSIFGGVIGGVMLIMFVLILTLSAAEVFVLFLGLFSLFKGLRCGLLFLALQSSRAVHLWCGQLGVLRHVGRSLGSCRDTKPYELVNDGDLLLLIDHMLRQRGLDTVSISKVKGHADDGMVLYGRVRREDKLGNDAADEAAGLGRRIVSPAVIDARRNLSGVCGRWYPVILDLHRFFHCYFSCCG